MALPNYIVGASFIELGKSVFEFFEITIIGNLSISKTLLFSLTHQVQVYKKPVYAQKTCLRVTFLSFFPGFNFIKRNDTLRSHILRVPEQSIAF